MAECFKTTCAGVTIDASDNKEECIKGTCGCEKKKCPCDCCKRYKPEDLKRIWRIGTTPDYPPFVSFAQATSDIIGFDIDLIKLIAEKLRFKIQIEEIEFDSLFSALDINYVDVLVGALTPTPERIQDFDFTNIYFESAMVLLHLFGMTPPITVVNDLNNKVIAAQTDSVGLEHLIKLKNGYFDNGQYVEDPINATIPDVIIYHEVDVEILVNKMANHTFVEIENSSPRSIDAIIMIDKVADNYIKLYDATSTHLDRTDKNVSNNSNTILDHTEECALALAKGNSLVTIINEIIDLLIADGIISDLALKWFGG